MTCTLTESTQADIVIGYESWLNPSISSSEVFPGNYISCRNDRNDGKGGGVFLLVSNKYESQEPEELTAGEDCELVWAKVKIQGSKDLYIGSYYKLPDKPNIWNSFRSTCPEYQLKMVPISGLEETSTWQILTGQTSVLCRTPAMVRSASSY